MLYPSFLAHVLSGILLFAAIGYALAYSQQFMKLSPPIKVAFLTIFSIAAGVHGISHMGLEKYYGYNPFAM